MESKIFKEGIVNEPNQIKQIEEIISQVVKASIEEEIIETIVNSIQEFNGEFIEDDEDRAYIIAINAKNYILNILKDKKYE